MGGLLHGYCRRDGGGGDFWRPTTRLAKIRLDMNSDFLQGARVLVCSRHSIGGRPTGGFLLALLACRRCVMLIGSPDKPKLSMSPAILA